jgi:hypothetical protein
MKQAVWSLALSLLSLSASAFTMEQRCVIANRDCFVLRAPAGGLSPERRMDRANERLAYILGNETLRPKNVRAINCGEWIEIRVGRSLLVTVTWADAMANGLEMQSLAYVWLQRLRVALPEAQPYNNRRRL